MQLLPSAARRGKLTSPVVTIPTGQSTVTLRLTPDLAALDDQPFGIVVQVWQQDPGGAPFSIRGAAIVCRRVKDTLEHLTTQGWQTLCDKAGTPLTTWVMTFQEELRRADLVDKALATVYDYTFQSKTYQQYAVPASLWLALDTYAADEKGTRGGDATITYAIDVETDARKMGTPFLPAGMEPA